MSCFGMGQAKGSEAKQARAYASSQCINNVQQLQYVTRNVFIPRIDWDSCTIEL